MLDCPSAASMSQRTRRAGHLDRLVTRIAVHARGFRKQRNLRLKIHMLVGDMERQNPAWSEMPLVNGDRLRRQQMQAESRRLKTRR